MTNLFSNFLANRPDRDRHPKNSPLSSSCLRSFVNTASYGDDDDKGTSGSTAMYATLVSRSLFRVQRQPVLVAGRTRFLTTPSKSTSSTESSDSASSASSSSSTPSSASQSEIPSASLSLDTPPNPSTLSLDFSPAEGQQHESSQSSASGQQRTGAKSSKDSLSSIERKRRNMTRTTLVMWGLGMIAGAVYMGREWEEAELKQMKVLSDSFLVGFLVELQMYVCVLMDYCCSCVL